MTHRRYHVVARSVPIVYTLEGDHDPNGMVFAPKQLDTLLLWARDRWYDSDELLPRLHTTRQRAQLVIDGLERLEAQLQRLRQGPEEDQGLLADLVRREGTPEYPEAEDRLSRGPRRMGGRAMAVRDNVRRTVDELRTALTALGDEEGPPHWREAAAPAADDGAQTEAPELDPATAPRAIRLVTLSPGQRLEWRRHWVAQAKLLDRSIEQWFTACAADPTRRFDAAALSGASGIPRDRVERLLLNDHAPGTNRGTPCNRFNPMKPIPALRPLVLRCRKGEQVEITVENQLRGRRVGFHVQGEGIATAEGAGVRYADGSHLGNNQDSTIPYGGSWTLHYSAAHEGVWPINDLADVRGGQDGTNAHGLFGALTVEPEGSRWRDPETGRDLTDEPWATLLDVDILVGGENPAAPEHRDFVDFHTDEVPRSFREFTVFFHDEPEIHSGLHTVDEHSVMPLSYRAEPMHNRLPHRMRGYVARTAARPLPPGPAGVDRSAFGWRLGDELEEQFLTARTSGGEWLERVAGEEQHHSSWLFGDPVTHVLRAYRGDPCRVRLVHAGVKETHVFHLHVHQWRAVASDTAPPSVSGTDQSGKPRCKGSQLLDSVTIGPQAGMTIDPLYGSGSRQHAAGDIIWHCHLYPHFHHGMWGLWRSYDRKVTGEQPYPDGSYCAPLTPLPGREPDPPKWQTPGFPWFVDGTYPMKSPPPPVPDNTAPSGRRRLLRMPPASPRERQAMPPACRNGSQPGAVFVDLDGLARQWNQVAGLPAPRIVSYDVEVLADTVRYNGDGWHDPRGHRYRLLSAEIREQGIDGQVRTTFSHHFPVLPAGFPEQAAGNPLPLFPRANHGDIVEWRHHNSLGSFPADGIDHGQLPVECGLHVHLVKFDPLASDGSATGWNYLSGASCREAVGGDGPGERRTVSLHRWVVDEEFGPCFFHDHLLANFRQKHGLFAALVAQPHGSQWLRADDQSEIAWDDTEAVIVPPAASGLPPYREACLAIADFVPLLDRGGRPLNPPSTLSGDDDPGSMAVNYRSSPLTFRGPDPSLWFSTAARSQPGSTGEPGDPDTPVFRTYPGERLRLRLIQGSHEEQHSFTAHGLRWRRDWGNQASTLANQQTIGISEAFTLDIDPDNASPYGVGDHLWHFSTADDIWLGCWGLVRSLAPVPKNLEAFSPLPDYRRTPKEARKCLLRSRATPDLPPATPGQPRPRTRTFVVVAQRTEHLFAGSTLTDPWGLIYRHHPFREGDLEQAIKDEAWPLGDVAQDDQPLVLRAKRGEWVRLILVNDVLREERNRMNPQGGKEVEFGVEPSPPRLPLEHLDELQRPDRRTVSSRVSLHPSLLLYDVEKFDGSHVGRNSDGTVPPRMEDGEHEGIHLEEPGIPGAVVHRPDHHGRNWREYWWYADEKLAPESRTEGPGQVCFLHDMADIRNHRHHGLIGALVVLPGDVEPYAPGTDHEAWTGVEAEIRTGDGEPVAHEAVLFFQDGLRHFTNGNPDLPVPDVEPTDDPEDSGQKALNYRSHPVHRGTV
ncbi:multicopper oxidase domain-containing protein, partial [Teichococcus vastitatis]